MRQGAFHDFECDDMAELCGPPARQWLRDRMTLAMRHSQEILAAARPVEDGIVDAPGLYFLIWDDLICYVGQGRSIYQRVSMHADEGRPFDKVAVLCGLPKWAQTEFEYAYIRAFDPPWNVESTRCGDLDGVQGLSELAATLDRSAVMPTYIPTVNRSHLSWPNWRLQVMARAQHLERSGVVLPADWP